MEIKKITGCSTGIVILFTNDGKLYEEYHENILSFQTRYNLNYNPFMEGSYIKSNGVQRDNFTTPLEKSLNELSLSGDNKAQSELEFFFNNYDYSNITTDYKSKSLLSKLLKLI